MCRTIPGTIQVEGREFLYVEIRQGEGFDEILDEALIASPDVPLPRTGGVIEEKARIWLEDGTCLLGISYRGDLAGWRAKFSAYCRAKHRKWAIVSGQELVLFDGTVRSPGDYEVIFDR